MKVAVLLSGGVDSSVAALLLRELGFEVFGLTMINYETEVAGQAKEAAEQIGIQHHIVDLRRQFEDEIISYFCRAYESGETPNPCVKCNRCIKFGILLSAAEQLGADKIATGHYARIDFDEEKQRWLLRKGIDLQKDQSYFLYGLTQAQLAKTIFPLGGLTKLEVRQKAARHGLKAAAERDSQEICFTKDYQEFLRGRVSYEPGDVVDGQGNIIGRHKGLPFYTVGQRKGLGISGGRPIYVVSFEKEKNQLVVDDEQYLFSRSLIAGENNFILHDKLPDQMRVQAKIRYRSQAAPATIYREDDMVRVEFDQPQRAITPGQSVVYYRDDYVVGGGIIAGPLV